MARVYVGGATVGIGIEIREYTFAGITAHAGGAYTKAV